MQSGFKELIQANLPKENDNVYIWGIPAGFEEEKLQETFEIYAPVVNCKLLPSRQPNSKGAAFVQYRSVEEAKTAIEAINGGQAPPGLPEGVVAKFAESRARPSNHLIGKHGNIRPLGPYDENGNERPKQPPGPEKPPSDNLHITQLPAEIDDNALTLIFAQFGTVVQAKVLPSKFPGGKSIGFVRYATIEEAMGVVVNFKNKLILQEFDKPITVKFADPHKSRPSGPTPALQSIAGVAPTILPLTLSLAPLNSEQMGQLAKLQAQSAVQNGQARETTDGDGQEPVLISYAKPGAVSSQEVSPPTSSALPLVPAPPLPPPAPALGAVPPLGAAPALETAPPLGAPPPLGPPPLGAAPALGTAGAFGLGGLAGFGGCGGCSLGSLVPGCTGCGSCGGCGVAGGCGACGCGACSGACSGACGGACGGACSAACGGVFGGCGGTVMDGVTARLEAAGCMPGGALFHCQQHVLQVDGLPPDTRDVHLYRLFASFGALAPKGSRAMLNFDGTCSGVGFVSYLIPESAQAAAATYNGCQLPGGRTLSISMATSMPGV